MLCQKNYNNIDIFFYYQLLNINFFYKYNIEKHFSSYVI